MTYKMTRLTPDLLDEALTVLSNAFAKNGVKRSFAEAYPRVFTKDARQLSDHFAAYPEGKDVHGNICGCISNCEMTYHVGNETLKISSSGNVAVKDTARGTGLMTIMFNEVDKSLHEDDFDLSYLHGARTRYNYFGYELCGVEYLFIFDMADLSKHYKPQNKFTFVDLSQREDLISDAIEIIRAQSVYIERRADELIKVYRARWRAPIGVFRNGEFWGSFAYGEGGINHLSLKSYEDFSEMVHAFLLEKNLSTIPFNAPAFDKSLLKNCITNCSSYTIGNPANFKILHFEKVIAAYLQVKADCEPLCDGQITLDSDLFGKYQITVQNAKVSVTAYEGEAKYHFKGFDVYDFLFNFTPNVYGEYDPAVKSWLPIPLYAPYLA